MANSARRTVPAPRTTKTDAYRGCGGLARAFGVDRGRLADSSYWQPACLDGEKIECGANSLLSKAFGKLRKMRCLLGLTALLLMDKLLATT